MNAYLVQRLSDLCDDAKEQLRTNPTNGSDRFRVKAYTDAILKLKAVSQPITCENDIPLNPTSKIYTKVVAFMKQYSPLPVASASQPSAYETLKGITGIGDAKARVLVDTHGIRTVEELRGRANELLNDKQRVGLRHYDHERIRIPRSEIEAYQALFNDTMRTIQRKYRIQHPWNMSINGSFRRGASDSGDIDCLISSASHEYYERFIERLHAQGYLREEDTLAYGDKKYMGYIYEPAATPRRLDIIYCVPEEFAFAQLYFTGSGSFNIRMREHAKKLGYRLNEKGLMSLKSAAPVEATFATEQDIFQFLGMAYVEPCDRT